MQAYGHYMPQGYRCCQTQELQSSLHQEKGHFLQSLPFVLERILSWCHGVTLVVQRRGASQILGHCRFVAAYHGG